MKRSPAYSFIKERVESEFERLEREKVTPWAFFLTDKGVRLTDFFGKQVSYTGGGLQFDGSPRGYFWDGFIQPFLNDIVSRNFSETEKFCREKGLDWRLPLEETALILNAGIKRVYRRMSDIDQRLRGKGYPNSVPKYDPKSQVAASEAFVQERLSAELAITPKKKTTMVKLPSFDTPFDTYHAANVIGEGGAGLVYEVANSSGETFALKCLAPEHVTSERLRRFKNEITFCQKQDHPNIVKVLDTGVTMLKDVKCPFYVMRRYAGTLRTHMRGLKHEDALRAFAQLLDGVEAAHLAGVWHRDLKPENVLWADRENALVVADFGIAHFEVEEIYTAVETKAASRMANFLYSAPEQRVRGAQVDRRADIFSLGLMLNELFTKEVPQGAGFKHIQDVNAAYAYIDDIVEAMIQQNPENRPATIETIKKELIGRKTAFVALQQYNAATKQVVSTSKPPEFEPISLVSLYYANGTLSLKLSRNVPPGWIQEFHNQRGGYSAVLGYEPQRFQIRGDTITIGVRGGEDESLLQQVVDHVKNYVAAANSGYAKQQQEIAARADREPRAALEREVAEAELRKKILTKVKL